MLSANDGRDVYHVRLILIFYIVHVLQCNEYNLYTELRVMFQKDGLYAAGGRL